MLDMKNVQDTYLCYTLTQSTFNSLARMLNHRYRYVPATVNIQVQQNN